MKYLIFVLLVILLSATLNSFIMYYESNTPESNDYYELLGVNGKQYAYYQDKGNPEICYLNQFYQSGFFSIGNEFTYIPCERITQFKQNPTPLLTSWRD